MNEGESKEKYANQIFTTKGEQLNNAKRTKAFHMQMK